MLTEDWTGLACSTSARSRPCSTTSTPACERYCSLVGRRAAFWHGDMPRRPQDGILRDPPDCLLTTPESLEVMLVSQQRSTRRLCSQRARGDRGRGPRLCGRRPGLAPAVACLSGSSGWPAARFQRIGLSATVGNPEELLDWLAGARARRPGKSAARPRRHDDGGRGQARLRRLACTTLRSSSRDCTAARSGWYSSTAGPVPRSWRRELRQLGVTTFVTHSSLSQDERRQAEEAFASRRRLRHRGHQRAGAGHRRRRSGPGDPDRRPGDRVELPAADGPDRPAAGIARNCLFLATDDDSLLRAAALVELWAAGYVEPVVPPPEPFHILAQQIMALALAGAWNRPTGVARGWLRGVPVFARLPAATGRARSWTGCLPREFCSDEEGLL